MAKIGLRNFLFGILTEDAQGNATYGTSTKPGKAISASVSITNNSATLDADDAVAESDTSFQSGTVTLGIDDDDLATMAILLGHTITDGEIVRNALDVAPYVGLGRIITKMVGGVLKYKVEFLMKVKFGEPSQEENTRSSEGIEFGTSEIEGTVSTLANGDWSKAEVFDTMSAAQAYLESFFEPKVDATVTFSAGSGSGSYPDIDTYVGAVITVPDGSALTPPTNKVFDGWDTSSSATRGDIKGSYKVTGDITLYAIYVAE